MSSRVLILRVGVSGIWQETHEFQFGTSLVLVFDCHLFPILGLFSLQGADGCELLSEQRGRAGPSANLLPFSRVCLLT